MAKKQGFGFLGCLGTLIVMGAVYYVLAKEFFPELGIYLPIPGGER